MTPTPIAPAPASGAAVTAGTRPPAVAASSLRAAVRALGVPWWLTAAPPSSTAGGAVRRETPAAVAVKPPPAVSVKRDPFDGSPAHLEAVMTTLCVLVVPASAIDRDPWGHPLGSGPELEPVELVKPGQPVTP